MNNLTAKGFSHGYWLNPDSEYVPLIILKMPIDEFPETGIKSGDDLLMAYGILLITYGNDSI